MKLALVNFTGVLRLIDNPLIERALGEFNIINNSYPNQYRILPYCVTNWEVPCFKSLSKAKQSFIKDCSLSLKQTLKLYGTNLFIFNNYKESTSLVEKYKPDVYITKSNIHLPNRGEQVYKSIFKSNYIEVSGAWNSIDLVKLLDTIGASKPKEIPYNSLSDILASTIIFKKPLYKSFSFIELPQEEVPLVEDIRDTIFKQLSLYRGDCSLNIGKYLSTGVISPREVLLILLSKSINEEIISSIYNILRRDLSSIHILKNKSMFIKESYTPSYESKIKEIISLTSQYSSINYLLEELITTNFLSNDDRIELVKFFKQEEIPLILLKILFEVYLLDYNPFITDYSIYLNL
jgi:deoxyribodipyrimidine photolyase